MPQPVDTEDNESAMPSHLRVLDWPDPIIERFGYDARSSYVEHYWLPVLGPSTTWLVRRLAAGLETTPEGYDCDMDALAISLGLGSRHGRHSPFTRAFDRAAKFGLVEITALPRDVRVRRQVPPLSHGQVRRLPHHLQRAHGDLVASDLDDDDTRRRRARRLALALFELGEPPDKARRHLHDLDVTPRRADAALCWALDRHEAAHHAARTA